MFMDIEPLAAGVGTGLANTSNSSLEPPPEGAACPVGVTDVLEVEFNWLKSANP